MCFDVPDPSAVYWQLSPAADQTPTPTRFLKNCEEVGLFNELASPFDHDFKKATEDDIKKVVVMQQITVHTFVLLFLFPSSLRQRLTRSPLPLVLPQLPLDLSPLATPIIRNKIEEPTAMEAHRDSPLPHPESTTSDDKVKSSTKRPAENWSSVISNLLWNLQICWYDSLSNTCLDLLVNLI